MTEASTHFPRWLGLLASVARCALAGVLTFWLLLALAWAGLHFWIVPRIDNFRPLLQERAQRLLGVDVLVQRLSARSEGACSPRSSSTVCNCWMRRGRKPCACRAW